MIVTFPFNFDISPRRADNKDDFPEPTWPTMATREPFETFKLIDFKVGLNSFSSSPSGFDHENVPLWTEMEWAEITENKQF